MARKKGKVTINTKPKRVKQSIFFKGRTIKATSIKPRKIPTIFRRRKRR